jgi:hypothetical protein
MIGNAHTENTLDGRTDTLRFLCVFRCIFAPLREIVLNLPHLRDKPVSNPRNRRDVLALLPAISQRLRSAVMF